MKKCNKCSQPQFIFLATCRVNAHTSFKLISGLVLTGTIQIHYTYKYYYTRDSKLLMLDKKRKWRTRMKSK